MPRSCPHCRTWIPTDDKKCPRCRANVNIRRVPPPKEQGYLAGRATPTGDDDPLGAAIALLLIMAAAGYAFVESFGKADTALSVVLAAVFVGCGALFVIAVRR